MLIDFLNFILYMYKGIVEASREELLSTSSHVCLPISQHVSAQLPLDGF
jgi:hypothetical protein